MWEDVDEVEVDSPPTVLDDFIAWLDERAPKTLDPVLDYVTGKRDRLKEFADEVEAELTARFGASEYVQLVVGELTKGDDP